MDGGINGIDEWMMDGWNSMDVRKDGWMNGGK